MNRVAVVVSWFVIGLAWVSGCSPAPPAASPPAAAEPAVATVARLKDCDFWEVYLLQGEKVGHSHGTIRHAMESGREVLRIEAVWLLSLRRGNEVSRQEIHVTSVETPEGQLVRFETDMSMGTSPLRTIGQVHGDRLDLETTGMGAAPVRRSIPWSPDYGGPFALEESLLRQPMQPGQRRSLKFLEPQLQQLVEVEMTAKGFESVTLPAGARELLRIETVTQFAAGQKVEQTVWTDRDGDMLKSHWSMAGGLDAIRVTKAEALAETPAPDLFRLSKVRFTFPSPQAHQTKQVRYRVRLQDGDPARAFPSGPTQAVRSIDAHTAEITVYAIRPGRRDGNPHAPADPPSGAERRPSLLIQSDDSLIVSDAQKAAGNEKDPWRVVKAIEEFVRRDVTKKDFSQAMASAAEVARSHEGDCTEHAVLLIALARARGIPARGAMGLVYSEGDRAFVYHMWAEVFVDGRWIPVDGTLALGGIGAAHLKIAQSDLKDATIANVVLPTLRVLGRLEIESAEVVDPQ
jgi:hypothetical protein